MYINNIHIQAPGTLILEQKLNVSFADNKSVLVISVLDTIKYRYNYWSVNN